ncbi:MAG: FMN-binding protein [Erysipelotrichales bacterium]|nr:FMN-binding protein [Erysipelotrichales bacterium]MBQ2478631.1 FMN-binding protein [Erysipelotrichales bacterium]
MKRKLILGLALMIFLGGCMNQAVKDVFVTPVHPDINTTSYLYTPGSYTGTGQGYNGPITVKITVNEANIIAIDILESAEANYTKEIEVLVPVEEGETPEQPVTGEEEPVEEGGPKMRTEIQYEDVEVIGKMDTVINEILANQSTSMDADLYTGATVTVQGLLEAITNAATEASLR